MSCIKTAKDSFEWKPIRHTIDKVKYAVLVLNHSMDHLNGSKSPVFDTLWQKAAMRLAVDGGAKYVTSSHTAPDILCGDFDSVTKFTLKYFEEKGTKIVETPDQNYTDFTKAVRIVKSLNQNGINANDSEHRVEAIVAIWSSSGRIDQVLAGINTLFESSRPSEDSSDGSYVPIFLFHINGSVSWLLDKGSHVMESSQSSKWCSLVPIGSPCCVTTAGFRWNLNKQVLAFGSLISTSNEFDKNEKLCRIETDCPLLFSMDISSLRF